VTGVLFTIALVVAPVHARNCPPVNDGLYLRELLAEARKKTPPAAVHKPEIVKLRDDVLQAARTHQWTPGSIDWKSIPFELRPQAFDVVSQLLTHTDSWTRGIALDTIVRLDPRRSVPLQIAMRDDAGEFDWMNDVLGNTVGKGIDTLVDVRGIARVPLDELDCPGAHGLAVERWVRLHLPYLAWDPMLRRYPYQPLPVRVGASLDKAASERQNGKQWLYIWPGVDPEKPIFEKGAAVFLGLNFANAGDEMLWVRHDLRDPSVHRFRLVGPGGKTQRPRPASLPEWRDREWEPQNPVLLGLSARWADDYPQTRSLQLERIFDLSEPGTYRLYYSYVPPSAEKRDPKEYSRPARLRFWEGRSYVNYYDFVIR
jgi:hypothetical protein